MTMTRGKLLCLSTVVMLILAAGRPAHAVTCDGLAAFRLSGGVVTSARVEASGTFTPPSTLPPSTGSAASTPLGPLPPFCRVTATLTPTPDSTIKIEVWLPVSGWTGRFVGVGNGGFGGVISYGALASALRGHAATASTDTGHDTPGGAFGLGHPEKIVDWASRSTHVMTEAAKAIVLAFYDRRPHHSYFTGCSTGGHQGLSEAQRYPADYDGILAGAHGANRTRLHASFLWSYAASRRTPDAVLPPEKLTLLHQAVLQACDANDGVKDGLLRNPGRCQFDPASLQCRGSAEPACLTAPQVEAVKRIYDGMRNPRTGELLYSGWPKGSEVTPGGVWADLSLTEPSYGDLFKYWVFESPAWDWRTFDFDKDMQRTDSKLGATVNALSADLSAFRARGGKLLMYHGLADSRVAAADSIDYYTRLLAALPSTGPTGLANDFARLFLVPGMAHCGGGPGPTAFDGLEALVSWVERREAPARITGAHVENGKTTMTRPLCPYPQEAIYSGSGDTNDASNFVCRVPN